MPQKHPQKVNFKISEGTCPQTPLNGCAHSTEVIQISVYEISKLMQTSEIVYGLDVLLIDVYSVRLFQF